MNLDLANMNLSLTTYIRELLQIAIKEIRETGHKKDILIVTDKKRLRSFYESLGLKVYSYYG